MGVSRALIAGKGKRLGARALVISPSQELCMQIVRVAQALVPETAKSTVQQCIGALFAAALPDRVQRCCLFDLVPVCSV